MKKNNLREKVPHNLDLAQFSVDFSNLDSKIQFRCFLIKIKKKIKQWTLFFEHLVIMNTHMTP